MSPSKTERQRRFMGAELDRKRKGEETVTGMTEEQLEDFASKSLIKSINSFIKKQGDYLSDLENSGILKPYVPRFFGRKNKNPYFVTIPRKGPKSIRRITLGTDNIEIKENESGTFSVSVIPYGGGAPSHKNSGLSRSEANNLVFALQNAFKNPAKSVAPMMNPLRARKVQEPMNELQGRKEHGIRPSEPKIGTDPFAVRTTKTNTPINRGLTKAIGSFLEKQHKRFDIEYEENAPHTEKRQQTAFEIAPNKGVARDLTYMRERLRGKYPKNIKTIERKE